jgi:hypothetical protein
VWEISAHHGYSTMWILSALRDNGHGRLVSFDIMENASKNIPDALRSRWKFVLGDIKQTMPQQRDTDGLPDYLFLDAGHSAAFGRFWTDSLLPQLRGHAYVSLHGVFNFQFWTDAKPERDLNVYPEWMPNEEGIVVLQWLALHAQQQCNLHSISPTFDAALNARFKAMRIETMGPTGVYDFDLRQRRESDSTIFFELNCQ